MRECQCLDTDLNLISDFTGKCLRISVKRSSLFAMASTVCLLIPEDIFENFSSFSIPIWPVSSSEYTRAMKKNTQKICNTTQRN